MNDERERSQFQSRLPDDGAYWADLAERIVGSAEPILREHAETQEWWHPLARWRPVIGVAALLLSACPPTLTSIQGCNDDFCGFQSSVSWSATAGTTYRIRVGVFPGEVGGTGTFTITESVLVQIGNFAQDFY